MDVTRLAIGGATLTRVPYAEVLVDAEVVGLTAAQVESVGWGSPTWAEDGRVRVAAAAWVVESDGHRVVVDPALAADDLLRSGADATTHQEAFASRLEDAGHPRESIDVVVVSHVDGIGMVGWRDGDGWTPFFPTARVLVSRRELAAILDDGPYRPSGTDALLALHDQGVVDTVDDEHDVTSDVATRWTGGHAPGHLVVRVAGGASQALLVGHLALSPLHLATGGGPHLDPAAAAVGTAGLRDAESILAGPLWPTPGAGRWTGAAFEPVARS